MSSRRPLLASALGFAIVIAAIASCATTTDPGTPTPSAATSTVSISAASVASGSGVTATLQAKDANGASVTTGGAAVTFALGGAGTSNGTFGPVTDNDNGTYTATFTGTVAGSARSISATLGGSAVTTTMPSIAVTPGPAAPASSLVEVSVATVPVGGTATLTLRARDAALNALTAGGLIVAFTKGAGTSDGSIGTVTDNANGTYTATFTATTAGTPRSIGATIGGNAVTSAAPTISVTPPVVSAATSIVAVNNATIQSGATSTITLQAKDANGTNITNGGATVTFGLGTGTSTGTISAVTDNSNGTYTATFTGVLIGTARAITATVNSNAVTTAQPTITVTPGAVSTTTSLVSVSSPTVVTGDPVTVTLTAKDAAGNQLASGGLIVAFTKGAGTSDGTISAATDNANGTYTATFTATTPGTARSIGATIGGNAVTSAAPTITVIAAVVSAATSVVTVNNATIQSGTTSTITLQAKAANGTNITNGGATVTFGLGAGLGTGNIGSVTDNNNGTYAATFTGVLVGTRSITATVNGNAVTTTQPTITVTPGAISATTSLVGVSSGAILSGATSTITLTAKDAAGNNLTTGTATVAFGLGTGTSAGTISAVTDNTNGTYSATFTGTTAGSARQITATVNSAAVTTTAPTIIVSPGVISTAQSLVTLSLENVLVAGTSTLTLTAKDAAGNLLTTGGSAVAFTKGSGTSDGTISTTTDHANGTYTATFTATTIGTARSIGATIGGVAVTTTSPMITVVPPTSGPPSPNTSVVTINPVTLPSGTTSIITLQARDASGVNFTTGGATVAFALAGAGTSTGTIGTVIDNNNGTYTATLTGVLAGTARNVSATLDGTPLTTTQPSFTVTPGAVSTTTSLVTVSSPTVVSGNPVTLTLTAKDAAGNLLTTGGSTVAFTKGSGTSDGTIGTTTDNANGTYTATFTATTAGTPRSIGATIGGNAVTGAAPTISVTPPVVSAATSVVAVNNATIQSGTTSTITLQAKDANGTNITLGGATVVFSLGAGTSTGTISAVTDNNNGTYTATFTGVLVGSARSIAATVNATAVTTTQPTITVTPGTASTTTSLVSVSSPTVVTGDPVTLTLTAKDAAGNQLASGGLIVAFTKGAGSSDGTIGAATDNVNGTYTATFSATTPGTARSIGATIGGVAVSTTLPTITVTAPVVSAATSIVTVNNASIQSGATSTITLQAKAANGTNITNGGATVAFSPGAGTGTGTISSVTDNNNGTYTATFTGVLIGTRSIAATVNAAAVTTTQPTITVTPGAISATTSIVGVSSGAIISGATSTLTLTAKDAAGNNLATGGATVAFGKGSGVSDGTISSVTDNNNGTYTATFTGTTAGTAREITATVNSAAVTTLAPTITVSPGALSLAQSLVSVSLENVAVAGTSTLTLTAKDAASNTLAVGGSTVLFTQTAGANPSTGTIGSVTDNNNGTYTATFTGSTAGTPLSIGATVGGNAVTTPKPIVIVYVKGITLTTTNITANATTGLTGGTHLIGVFANGSQTAAGLQRTIDYSPSTGVGNCTTANWLGNPTFDFPSAAPFSLLTINPTAAGLGIYTCTATVTISSSTPGVASQQFTVSLAVARTTVAQTAVNLVYMGLNANQNVTQQLIPDAKILITNGGRGIMTGLHATVDNQKINFGATDTAWINNTHLSWENDVAPADSNNRTAPRTLVIHAQVRPPDATATVHVSAAGMPTIDIPLNVFFNINLEIVTNPRGLTFNAFAGGTNVAKQVVTFNQNRLVTEDSLRHYEVFSGLPSWLTANVVPLTHQGMDTAATITFTANPTGLLADSVYTANVTVRAEICRDNFDGTCADDNSFDTFVMPVKFFVERGLVVPVANATIFAAAGTATVDRDIAITNGGSTPLSGISANVGAAPWLSTSFIGGTTAPTTLRLTANPTGFARGTVLNTTVIVSSTTPGAPSRSFPVTFRVY